MQRAKTASEIVEMGMPALSPSVTVHFARALLSGAVLDDVDNGRAGYRIFHREDVGRDFDEKAVEVAGIPVGEGFLRFLDGEPDPVTQNVVGLADELHVAVFDAVVDHFDEMAGAVGSDVGRARHAAFDRLAGGGTFEGLAAFGVHFGRDGLPDGGEFVPRGFGAAGHERGTEARAFLAAGHARTDEAEIFGGEVFFAADGVGPQRVAAIDDDVVRVKQRHEAVDDRVGGFAGLDEDDDFARALDRGDEVLEGQCGVESAGRVGVLFDEVLGFRGRAVEDGNAEAVVGDVEGEVLSHHGEADETDVGLVFAHVFRFYWPAQGVASPRGR